MELGLDLAGAVRLWSDEIYGDWYRDPWGWPELSWLKANLSKISIRDYVSADRSGFKLSHPVRFHLMDIPKSQLGVRPAVLQDPLSHFIYLASVGSSMEKLHARLPEFVFGWRWRSGKHAERNRDEWAQYIDHIKSGWFCDAGLRVDITSFFASVNAELIRDDVFQALGKCAASSLIGDIITAHDSLSRRSGIPQRNFGSSILAHHYVRPIDDAISAAIQGKKVLCAGRWMDDIVAFGREDDLYRLHIDLQEKARIIGLELNASKSRLASSDEVIDEIVLEKVNRVRVQWRSVQDDYSGESTLDPEDARDLDRLIELESVALSDIYSTPRPWLRAALVSLADSNSFDRQDEWRSNAKAIPHAADSLGRYLRAAATWGEFWKDGPGFGALSEWLVDYFETAWSALDWVKAQLALAVPTNWLTEDLRLVMESWLEKSSNVQLVALAGQRLASSSPDVCMQIIRSRTDSSNDPLLDRALALAFIQAGGERRISKSILRRDPANILLDRALEDNSWQCPKVVDDFDGSG